jgi:ribosomal protein S18 acetylase RimI-like enzyme
MGNAVLEGDELLVLKGVKQFRIGDILLFHQVVTDLTIAHRLIRVASQNGEVFYGLAGDANPFRIDWIKENSILGRVEMIIRNGKTLSPFQIRLHSFFVLGLLYFPTYFREMLKKTLISFASFLQSQRPYRFLARILFGKVTTLKIHREDNLLKITAVLNHKVAGYICLTSLENKAGIISNLIVRARFRGLGIGTRLLTHALEEATNQQIFELSLKVDDTSKQARNLYARFGFNEIGNETQTVPPFKKFQIMRRRENLEGLFLNKLIFSFFKPIELSLFSYDQLDWEKFKAELKEKQLALLITQALKNQPETKNRFPQFLIDWFQNTYYVAARQNILYQAGLKEFLGAAGDVGLRIAILRGPALANVYYPDPLLRTSCDIDILMKRESALQLHEVCSRLQLKPQIVLGELVSFHREGPVPINIDLHKKLWYADEKSIWQRMRKTHFEAQAVEVLSPEDLVIHLIAHAMTHHARFSHHDAIDLGFVISKEKNLDWDYIQAAVKGTLLQSFLQEALNKMVAITGVAIPEKALCIFPEGVFARALQGFNRRLIGAQNHKLLHYYLKPLTMKKFSDRLKFVVDHLFPDKEFIRTRYQLTKDWQVTLFQFLRPLISLSKAFLFPLFFFGSGKVAASRDLSIETPASNHASKLASK